MKTLKNHKNQASLDMDSIKKVLNTANMKVVFRQKSLFSALLLSLALNTQAGWMDDWVDQSTSSGPNYFEGQKRGYFSGGSYSARYRNSNDYLFSIQKPRLKSGCGGVDLFMGGFSFLDPEYLMQKMQRAIQAAPAIAFDLALKELSPSISSAIGKFEAIINQLNDLQMNECAMSKEIVTALSGRYESQSGGFSEIASLFDTKQSAEASSAKNYTHSKEQQQSNNNRPTQPQSEGIKGCSAEFKKVFAKNGSLLKHVAEQKGLEQYADYMRAYLGDVIISYSDNQYSHRVIEPCSQVKVDDMDEILTGNAFIKPENGGACTRANDQGLLEVVDSLMHSIALKIRSKRGNYTSNEINFLSSIPAPVFKALNTSAQINNIDFQISVLREPTARAMSYAIVHDLVNKIYELTRLSNQTAKQANNGATDEFCEPAILGQIMDVVNDLKVEAIKLSLEIKKAQAEQIRLYVDNINFNSALKNQGSGMQSNTNQGSIK